MSTQTMLPQKVLFVQSSMSVSKMASPVRFGGKGFGTMETFVPYTKMLDPDMLVEPLDFDVRFTTAFNSTHPMFALSTTFPRKHCWCTPCRIYNGVWI